MKRPRLIGAFSLLSFSALISAFIAPTQFSKLDTYTLTCTSIKVHTAQ